MAKKAKTGYWSFVNHKGGGTIPDCVTAKCSVCGKPLFCSPYEFAGTREEGTIIFSGFFMEIPEEIKKSVITSNAEQIRAKLPKFCACCGTEMTVSLK